jgi:WD40 repeat protein
MVCYRSWGSCYQGRVSQSKSSPTGLTKFGRQIWDLASGELKLSLTGHISTVRGLAVSDRHPYLFSCAEDKVSPMQIVCGER